MITNRKKLKRIIGILLLISILVASLDIGLLVAFAEEIQEEAEHIGQEEVIEYENDSTFEENKLEDSNRDEELIEDSLDDKKIKRF